MAKEKNLTTVTSVAAADFARLVTSAGASVKATAANLAKYVIETYNGSTVAGSAQSVKSALDSLNSKFSNTTFSSVSDLYNAVVSNAFMTGVATGGVVSALTNGDSDYASRFIGYRADATTADILLFSASNGKIILSRIANGTPTRAYRVSATQITL